MTTNAACPSEEHGHIAEATFRVMGTDAHLLVVGGPQHALVGARHLLDRLEARWSRFRPDSELCRLNDAAGAPVVVSEDTFTLIEHACDAWWRTGGLYDPTVLPALERAGYDRDFDAILPEGPASGQPQPAPGCAGIALDRGVRVVHLPAGVRLDLGGIGKGYAADLVAEHILDAGAAGVCVNLGGDLRVHGESPSGDGWVVEVETPVGDTVERTRPLVALAAGAIATTSRLRRTWQRGGVPQHHVIDPRTGAPAVTPWISATVIAGRAVCAEPLAKVALLAATSVDADATLRAHGVSGLLVDSDVRVHPVAGAEAFLLAPVSSDDIQLSPR